MKTKRADVDHRNMGCHHESEVHLLIEGLLDAEKTRRMMDHIRTCDDCRSRMEFRSDTEGRPSKAGLTPTFKRYSWDQVSQSKSRRGKTWLRGMIAMIAVLGLTYMAMHKPQAPPPQADPDREASITVQANLALVRWPEGQIERRPRTFEIILPDNDVATITLRISRDGAAVWEKEITPDQPGVAFDPFLLEDPTTQEKLPSRRVMSPFPAVADLPLDDSGEYLIRAFLDERPGPVTRFNYQPEADQAKK